MLSIFGKGCLVFSVWGLAFLDFSKGFGLGFGAYGFEFRVSGFGLGFGA